MGAHEVQDFLRRPVVVEEKVDGANTGIAFDSTGEPIIWNRGTVLTAGGHAQFQPLWRWLAEHRAGLASALGERLVLFGEWCFAIHTVRYDRLPDWFLAFDVYEKSAGRFWSSDRRDTLVRSLGLFSVPVLASGIFTLADLASLLVATKSRYGHTPIEGLYARVEREGWLVGRAKLVRPEFMRSIDRHWTSRHLRRNVLAEARQ
ncbi:MAG: RNA ligase family protein [Gemmataceae bacterium]